MMTVTLIFLVVVGVLLVVAAKMRGKVGKPPTIFPPARPQPSPPRGGNQIPSGREGHVHPAPPKQPTRPGTLTAQRVPTPRVVLDQPPAIPAGPTPADLLARLHERVPGNYFIRGNSEFLAETGGQGGKTILWEKRDGERVAGKGPTMADAVRDLYKRLGQEGLLK